MAARWGEPLVAPVLRPLAERVVDVVRPQPGEHCLDALCDGGTMATALARAVGRTGSVLAVDEDAGAVAECAAHARALGLTWLRSEQRGLRDLPPDSAGVVASLLTLADASDPQALLRGLAAACSGPGSRLAVAVWAEPAAVPHEEAIAEALMAVTGSATPVAAIAGGWHTPQDLHAAAATAGVAGAQVHRLRDVVRFNGPDHLWAALVDARPAVAAHGLNASAVDDAIALVARRLSPYAAADGTLVVPVELLVLSR